MKKILLILMLLGSILIANEINTQRIRYSTEYNDCNTECCDCNRPGTGLGMVLFF